MLKKYRYNIIGFYVLAAIALLLAAFFDLKIDIALNNPENPFAVWFYNCGESPAHLVCPIAGMMIAICASKKNVRILGSAVCLFSSTYFGFYLGKHVLADNGYRTVYSLVFGAFMGVVLLFISQFIHVNKNLKKTIVIVSFVAIGAYATEIFAVTALKYLWGRVRFRDLLSAGSYDEFTSWLHPNGINGNKSFPSGHTGNAGMFFLMMFLPTLSKKWEKYPQLCFIIPLIWTVTVAFTRLVMGAHYLSDVSAGAIIAFTCSVAAIAVYEKLAIKHIEPQQLRIK